MIGFALFTIFSTFALTQAEIIIPGGISRQVHAQGPLGQYHYGYSDGLSAKEEVRSFDGTTRGSYSYVDPNGKLQTVDYVADSLRGFRVAGTNLPKVEEKPLIAPLPVKETPEVIKAKEEHLKIVEDAKRGMLPIKLPERVDLPKPVVDTPEVAKAKAEHLEAKKTAELLAKQPEFIVREPFIVPTAYPWAVVPERPLLWTGYRAPLFLI